MWGWIIGAAVLIGAGAAGATLYKRAHAHTSACPTDAQVQKAVSDVDGNGMTLPDAVALANTWDQNGCPTAAYTLRAMITIRRAKEDLMAANSAGGKLTPAIVNWLPGCVPPAGFIPPASWSPGNVPGSTDVPGWTPPVGWKLGDPLPTDYACPSGWTKAMTGGSGTATMDSAIGDKMALVKGNVAGNPNQGLGRFAAVGAIPRRRHKIRRAG